MMRWLLAGLVLLIIVGSAFAQGAPVPPQAVTADSWFNYALDRVTNVHGLGAVLAGLVFGFVLPQFLKMNFPVEWSPDFRRRKTMRLAFWSTFWPIVLIWPVTHAWASLTPQQWYTVVITGLVVAGIFGAATPFTYKFLMHWAYRFGLAHPERWSGETRADMRAAERDRPVVPGGAADADNSL